MTARPTASLAPDPRARVALETTLLVHGVPASAAKDLAHSLASIVRAQGAVPAIVGIRSGRPIVGMSDDDLAQLLSAPPQSIPKLNTANLGQAILNKSHGATTVSTTMELAAAAGVSVFATGGLGGVHHQPSNRHSPAFDISADLFAFTRFPVAVVASGVKSILDIAATREVLETLGIPVVGFQTSDFPAFYLRKSPDQQVGPVDVRIDDVSELARFCRGELARTRRGIVICNPVPAEHELSPVQWATWLKAAEVKVAQSPHAHGRAATPALLAALHELSRGATLRANIALVENNTRLAAQLARALWV